jgi:uncharacterized protein YjbI with pentapeptide repeats
MTSGVPVYRPSPDVEAALTVIGTRLADSMEQGKLLDLHDSDIRGANLLLANLSEIDLSGADMRCAELRGSSLNETNLYNADIRGANLDGATGLKKDQVVLARCDKRTVLPSDLSVRDCER